MTAIGRHGRSSRCQYFGADGTCSMQHHASYTFHDLSRTVVSLDLYDSSWALNSVLTLGLVDSILIRGIPNQRYGIELIGNDLVSETSGVQLQQLSLLERRGIVLLTTA